MDKKSSEDVLEHMIELFIEYLEELTLTAENESQTGFIEGEKTAYVECLEIISEWKYAKVCGLDFEIEDRFPLIEKNF